MIVMRPQAICLLFLEIKAFEELTKEQDHDAGKGITIQSALYISGIRCIIFSFPEPLSYL